MLVVFSVWLFRVFWCVVKIFCKFVLTEEMLVSVILTNISEPKIVEQKALKNLVYFWRSELKKIRSFL